MGENGEASTFGKSVVGGANALNVDVELLLVLILLVIHTPPSFPPSLPPKHVNNLEALREVIQSKGVERPLVLRFHASWCSVRREGGREMKYGSMFNDTLPLRPALPPSWPAPADIPLTQLPPSLPPSLLLQACKKFAPSWQQTANAYNGHFDFVDVDVTVREGGREGGSFMCSLEWLDGA